jgi:protein-serine/threonine kinase
VQLCDFGVSGTLEPEIAKRSTIVGTPYWMAPELQKEWIKDADPNSRVEPAPILYGSEVDIWAYGCTVFEMATGFPPFHRTMQLDLPQTGIPQLEGDRYSDELKDFLSMVLQGNPQDRPIPDQMLEHPYLAETTKMYPTVMLVTLIENYVNWENKGGARASLFNPYGAQAPDPLAPDEEDEDDDWTFSTTDEFEKRLTVQFSDLFNGEMFDQDFAGMNPPPADDDRFTKLQATIREEQINRGKRGLGRLFDQNSTPYRYSGLEPGGRPPSDLILRDFNPGAPNRKTIIDLDFSLPTMTDVPSIDLGEVPTVKANRVNMNRLLREMELEDEEEQRDSFDQNNQLDKRATREWTFPKASESSNRKTVEWKFPSMSEQEIKRATRDWKFPPTTAEKPNRRTVEWTFDAAMAESNYEPLPKGPRMSRLRDTQEFSTVTSPREVNRQTRDFVFPPREDHGDSQSESELGFDFSSSPTLGLNFQSTLRRASTDPTMSYEDDDYPRMHSAPASPTRNSRIEIDLDMAYVEDDYRPSTSGSASTSTYTTNTEQLNGNPFDLEDQVQLSQANNRASYHMKSQSEPNHAIPGLLTPQTYDEQGYPTNQDPHHPSMHARGVSSVSQMQAQIQSQGPSKVPSNTIMSGYYKNNNRSQHLVWDGWNHTQAYGLSSDESPPTSVSTDNSIEEEDVDYLWDAYEKATMANQRRQYSRQRRNESRDDDPRSDAEDNYADFQLQDDLPARPVRVSVGPGGKPLVDFAVPRGPDPESLLGMDTNPAVLQNALWRATTELRDGLRASRDLMRSMRLQEQVRPVGLQEVDEEEGEGLTVRVNRP